MDCILNLLLILLICILICYKHKLYTHEYFTSTFPMVERFCRKLNASGHCEETFCSKLNIDTGKCMD